ncbi:MAG: hypothetical protein ACRD5M_01360 [Candidatus Acidiferrales bacterium]
MKSILLAGILLVTFSLQAQAPVTAPVALKDEPHHHLLFENDYVRAWAFGIHGREATLLHNHDLPYFGIALGAAEFVNAVSGKPETHVALADGQVSYSKGGFAHLVRTETDAPFRNFTIELLKPQGAPRNRCVKVIADGALDCPKTAATPLAAATTLVFETDEVAMQSGEVASVMQIGGADAKAAHLLAVMDQSDLSVGIPGKPPTIVHAGEAIWLPAGTAATLLNQSKGNARFFLLTFKDSTPI